MFLKTFKHFLLIYFLFGLSPYFTIKTKLTKCEKLFRFVPSCIYLTITIAIFINSFVMNRSIFLVHGKINDFIAYGYLLTLGMSNLSGNYQCLRYHNVYFDLIKRIYRNDKLSIFTCHKSLKTAKTIVVKGLIIFAAYSAALIVLFLNETTLATILIKIEIAVLQFGSSLNTLHAIMYVEIVRSYLQAGGKFILNASLTYDEMYRRKRCLNLKNFKKIYFDWWNIMQKINIFFGWSLLASLIKCFVEISYTLYYYFLVLQTEVKTITIIRKHLRLF